MTDEPAPVIILSDYKREREDYQRRRTERHKRRLQKSEDEAIGLPAFPGGEDDINHPGAK